MKTASTILTAVIFSAHLARANVVGADTQNFNSITSGLDFVTVQSSETLRPGYVNLGLFLNYAVNSLPYFDNTPQGRTSFNDSLLGVDMNLGLGLARNWDVGVSLPFVLSQDVKADSSLRGEFAQTGNTEVRLNSKYRLSGDDGGGTAVVGSVNFNRIIDNPYSGVNAGPTYNLEAVADTTLSNIAVGLNLGYRWRSPGRRLTNSPIQPLKNQFIASVAASYLFSSVDTKIITEIFSGFPAESSNSDLDRSLTQAEWIVGAKHDITNQLAVHFGGGTELIHGVSSPDWRLYTGLNYSFGPVWESGHEEAPALEVVKVAQQPAQQPKEERFRTRKIYFDFDSDKMVGDYATVLQELARNLKRGNGFTNLVIEGHTDSVGAAAYNEDLSDRRAQSIRKYLVDIHKMPATKIEAIGYGESQPIADNGNFQGRQMNRRVEFKIIR